MLLKPFAPPHRLYFCHFKAVPHQNAAETIGMVVAANRVSASKKNKTCIPLLLVLVYITVNDGGMCMQKRCFQYASNTQACSESASACSVSGSAPVAGYNCEATARPYATYLPARQAAHMQPSRGIHYVLEACMIHADYTTQQYHDTHTTRP